MAPGDDAVWRQVIAESVAAAGCDLEDIVVTRARGRRGISVIVDRDTGVDTDIAGSIGRDISQRLDQCDDEVFHGDRYTLEVTSRGIDRPLVSRRHFRRSIGRLVRLTAADGQEHDCRVVHAADDGLTVLAGRDGMQVRTWTWPEVDHATVQVEFQRPPSAVRAAVDEWLAGTRQPGGDLDGTARREGSR